MFCLCSHCFFGVRAQYETLTHLGHQSAVDSSASASLGLSLADFITAQGHQLRTELRALPAPPAASFPSPQTETPVRSLVTSPAHRSFLSMNSAILGSLYRSCPLCLGYVIPNRVVQVVACVGMESVCLLFCGTSPCVAQTGLALSLPSDCWGYRFAPSHPGFPL